MTPPARTRPGAVAVVGNYGGRNLGDEATLAAIVEHLRRRAPRSEVCVLSFDPDDTVARHGLRAFPARPRAPRRAVGGPLATIWERLAVVAREVPFVARAVRLLRGVDLLIVGGSGQLIDHFGGPWGFPYLLCSWAILAHLAGARVAFVSVGGGPLDSPLSRRFVTWALRLADYRSFRNAASRALVESLGVRTGNALVPDLVFGLDPGEPRAVRSAPGLTVAINLFPHHDPRFWPRADASKYRRYLDEMARFVLWLLEHGHTVRLFPTHLRADPRVAADLRAVLAGMAPGSADALVEADVHDVAGVRAEVAAADIAVAMRHHGILFALLEGTPVVAVTNHQKMEHLMRDHGQGGFLLSADSFTADDLIQRFTALTADRDGRAADLRRRTSEMRARVAEQFDHLFGPVAAASAGDSLRIQAQ